VRDWVVLGPIPTGTRLHSAQDGPENRAVLEKVLNTTYVEDEATLSPNNNERALIVPSNVPTGDAYHWERIRSEDGALDFVKLFRDDKQPSTNAVAYAVATINVPRETKNATLLFGSDDAAKVWLNGEVVHTVTRVRGVSLDEDEIRGLTLKPGRNVLVVKVAQGIGGWGLSARFELPNGLVLRTAGRPAVIARPPIRR
jgi:hypothetical protein